MHSTVQSTHQEDNVSSGRILHHVKHFPILREYVSDVLKTLTGWDILHKQLQKTLINKDQYLPHFPLSLTFILSPLETFSKLPLMGLRCLGGEDE